MGLKALVIEDSLVFQKIMSAVLEDLGGVDEIRVAGLGQDGLSIAETFRPDVIFLDLHLPDLDGMDVLDELKKNDRAQRVVVVSGMSSEGADLTIQALSKGAQQFVRKPSGGGFQASVDLLRDELKPVLKTVAMQVGNVQKAKPAEVKPAAPVAAPAVAPEAPSPKPSRSPMFGSLVGPPPEGVWITAIAVSTGGPQSLQQIIPRLPANYPVPVVLVQHMPPLFTDSLAQSLDRKSQVRVVEAQASMVLQPGTVYIAPGGKHLVINQVDGQLVTALNEAPPEQSVRPAADVLFRSLSQISKSQAVLAVVLTGMGEDGLAGVRALKKGNCRCLTQSEETCVVYGMPRAVDKAGLSDESVNLEDMADRMARMVSTSSTPVGAK